MLGILVRILTVSEKHGLKAILDANIWVSAIVCGGLPASIVKAAEDGRFSWSLKRSYGR